MGKPALFCSQLGFNFNLEKKDAFFFLLQGKEREEIKQYKKGFFFVAVFFPTCLFYNFCTHYFSLERNSTTIFFLPFLSIHLFIKGNFWFSLLLFLFSLPHGNTPFNTALSCFLSPLTCFSSALQEHEKETHTHLRLVGRASLCVVEKERKKLLLVVVGVCVWERR